MVQDSQIVKNGLKWSKMVKMVKNGQCRQKLSKWSEIVKNGQKKGQKWRA